MFLLKHRFFSSYVCLCGLLTLLATRAEAQVELIFGSQASSVDATEVIRSLDDSRDSSELLERLRDLYDADQLWMLQSADLPYTTLPISGWRWDSGNVDGNRTIIAIDGPLLVAIRESKRHGISLSVEDRSRGSALARGRNGQPRYFGHTSTGIQHLIASSAEHLSRKSPELFKIYFYFSGPHQSLVRAKSLPSPPWAIRP